MTLWDWVQLVAAALAIGALVVAFAADRRAASCKTLDRFNEAWENLFLSRLALLLAVLLAAVAVAAAFRL